MNFQVPQFIEVEDRIFGPLSFRQFLYLAGGGGLAYIFFTFEKIPLVIRLVPISAAIALGLALAFYKVNDRPLLNAIESGFNYFIHGKLYLWKRREAAANPSARPNAIQPEQGLYVPKLSDSKLKDLSWSLDVNEKIR